jgi:hypothetical protein
MNKMLLVIIAFASFGAFAKPTPIYDTTSMTCAQGRAAVQRNGFQHFTVNGSRYRTFYANSNDRDVCPINFDLKRAWVPTADTTQCPIGFECVIKGW